MGVGVDTKSGGVGVGVDTKRSPMRLTGGGERHKRSRMYNTRATSAITCTTHLSVKKPKQEIRVPILSILLLSTIGNGTSDTTLHGVCSTIAPGFQMVRPAWVLDR